MANADTDGTQRLSDASAGHGVHARRELLRRGELKAAQQGSHIGNIFGNGLIAVANAAQAASSVINVVPVAGDEVAAVLEATSAVVAVTGNLANGEVQQAAFEGVSRGTTAMVRAAEGLAPGSDEVDAAATLATGSTASTSIGNFAGRLLTGGSPGRGRNS